MATTITAHGQTYTGLGDAHLRLATLRAENEAYGESDGRVTEINTIEAAIAEATAEPVGYEVVRDEYPVPCEHPLCALLHRRFHEGTEVSDELVQFANGTEKWVRVRGIHEKMNREWIILLDGRRVGSAHATKRDAQREIDTFHPTI